MPLFSFDKQASNYALYSSLQNKIARNLVSKSVDIGISRILDLGAGNGNVALNLYDHTIDYFLGIDSSLSMLNLHPRELAYINHLELRHMDFEYYDFDDPFDLVIASSSLHWANDLESLFKKMNIESKFAFSIFTSNSLASIHSFVGSKSPLRSTSELMYLIDKYFVGDFELLSFREDFDTREKLLLHLKYNGLLGGNNISFGDKKRLKFEFPSLFLDYEVLFFIGRSRYGF